MSWVGLIGLIAGSLVFAFSGPSFNGYLAGFVLLSAGGPFVFISTLHVAALFPSKSGLVMAFLNGSYGFGALIFLIFNSLFYQYHISLKVLFIAYAVILGCLTITTFFLWPWSKFPEQTGIIDVIPEEPARHYKTVLSKEEHYHFIGQNSIQEEKLSQNYVGEEFSELLKEPSYWKKLKENALNLHFLYIVIFIALMISKSSFYLATSNQQLRLVTNNEDTQNLYEYILALMIPVLGMAVSPLGLIIDKFGINVAVYFYVAMSCICDVLGIVRNSPLQILRFIVFSIYYPFTFTLWADFIAKKFGFINYGVLFGIVALVSGIFGFAETSLVNFAVETNQYDWVNIGWMICTILGLIYPVVTTFCIRDSEEFE